MMRSVRSWVAPPGLVLMVFGYACRDPDTGGKSPDDSGAADSGLDTDVGGADSGAADSAADSGDSGGDTGDTGSDTADTGDTGSDSGDTGWGPSTRWVGVSADGVIAAAVTDGGRLACWGQGDHGTGACPEGYFGEVAQGLYHGCAIDAAGAITCWHQGGDEWAGNDVGQTDAPEGVFHGIDAVYYETCALDETSQAVCWGNMERRGGKAPPRGTYAQLALAYGWALGLTMAGDIEIWGGIGGGDYEIELLPTDGPYTAVAAGVSHACVLDTDGRASCWGGRNDDTIEAPQDVRFLSLDAGYESTCGITTDQAIRCWETHSDENVTRGVESLAPTEGTWEAVSVGWEAACAISTDGELTCWGARVESDGLMPVPDLPE